MGDADGVCCQLPTSRIQLTCFLSPVVKCCCHLSLNVLLQFVWIASVFFGGIYANDVTYTLYALLKLIEITGLKAFGKLMKGFKSVTFLAETVEISLSLL